MRTLTVIFGGQNQTGLLDYCNFLFKGSARDAAQQPTTSTAKLLSLARTNSTEKNKENSFFFILMYLYSHFLGAQEVMHASNNNYICCFLFLLVEKC
jgi:hypothetical protein